MTDVLNSCLEDLEARIDEQQEEELLAAWQKFVADECDTDYFVSPRRRACQSRTVWPEVAVNQAIDDVEAMLLGQLGGCSQALANGGDLLLNVRANYGTGILPSLFGCELFMMDTELNTLPTVKPLGSLEAVKAVVDAGPPDIHNALGGRTLEAGERFMEAMGRYPKIARYVSLYHPDLQGPINVAELIWGSDIFLAYYDEPDLLRGLLEVITQTYRQFLRAWYDMAERPGETSVHWGLLHGGAIVLRNDSLMNLSPDTYTEFVQPYDQRLLDEFGGGAVHFCGRGDHYIELMSRMRGLTAINLTQPEYNDMETIFRHTVDKGIKIIGLEARGIQGVDRPLRGRVHVSSPAESPGPRRG